MSVAQKFTGLKYDDDCGWYALLNGRICQPEIDGTLQSARAALAKARPASGGFDVADPETRLIVAEQKAQNAYAAILNAGGAGSAEAMQAHSAWMTARTARATFDAERKAEQLANLPIAASAESIFRYAPTLATFDVDNGWEY